MKFRPYVIATAFLLGFSIFFAGCTTTPSGPARRYVFPRPPDPPKIEWIKSYYSQHDFPKSGMQTFMETLFGEAVPIKFEKPIDVVSDGKGLVYVTDITTKAIHVYDLNNYTVRKWEKTGGNDAALAITPFFVSLDSDGNVYTVGVGDKKIYVLNPAGVVTKKIDFSGKIKDVAGISVDTVRRRIYVVDLTGGKVEVFSLQGEHLFSFGKPGEGEGELNRPSPIAINHKGEVIIGDTMNGRIQIFDGDGKFLRKFGERGDGNNQFQILKGIAVDSEDNIYVTDGKANQIKIFNSKGDFLLGIGTAFSVAMAQREAPGGFLLPQGIYIDSTDHIYVTDQANCRFQIFRYLKDEPGSGAGKDGKRFK